MINIYDIKVKIYEILKKLLKKVKIKILQINNNK